MLPSVPSLLVVSKWSSSLILPLEPPKISGPATPPSLFSASNLFLFFIIYFKLISFYFSLNLAGSFAQASTGKRNSFIDVFPIFMVN
jgi:hypothetical protein